MRVRSFLLLPFCMTWGSFNPGMETRGPPAAHPAHGTSLSTLTCVTSGVPSWLETGLLPPPCPELGPLQPPLVLTCPAKHQHPAPGSSSGMLVGISRATLPKPITCISIVLIVAFKIITGWRERTGRALRICTTAWAHRCVRYRRFAA